MGIVELKNITEIQSIVIVLSGRMEGWRNESVKLKMKQQKPASMNNRT